MKLYTKTGDEGSTLHPDGKLRKTDPRVAANGTVDELNACLGLCIQGAAGMQDVREALVPLQVELFAVGALLAGSESGALDDAAVGRMETQIDAAWEQLPELTHFIVPGGCELACRLHVARTVCRRAERTIVAVCDAGHTVAPIVLRYINRLGDLLFALARLANFRSDQPEATV